MEIGESKSPKTTHAMQALPESVMGFAIQLSKPFPKPPATKHTHTHTHTHTHRNRTDS